MAYNVVYWTIGGSFVVAVGLACGGSIPTAEIASLPPLVDLGPRDAACMIDDTIDPSLQPRQEDVLVDVHQEIGRTVESLTFADGTPVRIVKGGCVHFGETFTVGLAAEPEAPLAEAVRQMNRLVFADGQDTVRRALLAADGLDDMGYFPCGDATCDVRVQVDGDSVRLIVAYDFPL